MSSRLGFFAALVAGCVFFPATVSATGYDDAPAYEAASHRWLLYQHVEYPARIRSLHDEIELTRAEIETLQRLLQEYGSINRFGAGSALTFSASCVRLELLAAEKRLDSLERELALTRRFRPVALRLRAIESGRAARSARPYGW